MNYLHKPPIRLPENFFFDRHGLWYRKKIYRPRKEQDQAAEYENLWIAAPFEVVGETRDENGENWGLLLRWRDRDGRLHQWAVPRRLFHDDGCTIVAELENAGLQCSSYRRAHGLLKQFISEVITERRLRCVDRTGWYTADEVPVFVLPNGEAFGNGRDNVILQTEYANTDISYRAQGSLEEWQEAVARYAIGNDRFALFLSAAFVGPLLDVVGAPSGGL